MITMQLLSTEGSRMTGQLNLFEVMLSVLKCLLGRILPSRKLPCVHKMTVFDQNKVSNLDSKLFSCF